MFKAIPKETIVASVEIDGRTVAVGLGILDRGHVGLYAIYVDASAGEKDWAVVSAARFSLRRKRKAQSMPTFRW